MTTEQARKGLGPGGGRFDIGVLAENPGSTLPEPPSMPAEVAGRFRLIKLASSAAMARRGEEDGWGGMGPGLSAGWRDADADVAFRLATDAHTDEPVGDAPTELLATYQADPTMELTAGRIPQDRVDRLAQYCFDRAMSETVNLTAAREAMPKSRAGDTACGLRNAYALSYAQLTLGGVDSSYAHTVADRLTSALYDGTTDPDELHDIAWDANPVFNDWADDEWDEDEVFGEED